jgi:hypothetical protein
MSIGETKKAKAVNKNPVHILAASEASEVLVTSTKNLKSAKNNYEASKIIAFPPMALKKI